MMAEDVAAEEWFVVRVEYTPKDEKLAQIEYKEFYSLEAAKDFQKSICEMLREAEADEFDVTIFEGTNY